MAIILKGVLFYDYALFVLFLNNCFVATARQL